MYTIWTPVKWSGAPDVGRTPTVLIRAAGARARPVQLKQPDHAETTDYDIDIDL